MATAARAGRRAPTGWAEAAVAASVAALEPLADPVRAVPMAAYMRDRFPFLGVGAPARRAALRTAWRDLGPPPSTDDLARAARALWDLPAREYVSAGCDLLARYVRHAGPELLEATPGGPGNRIEHLVTTHSWWDSVDALRPAAVGPLVAAHPELVAVLDRWIASDDVWLVRSALIHQLGYRGATDADRLFRYCELRAEDREFFVAKAVGWALRTYAREDADAVRRFVDARPGLTPLARREALKHL